MNFILVLCLCVASTLASDDWGGHDSHQFIKAPAFTLPIPEIGLSFDKLPIFIPLPKIILRKNPTLISKPQIVRLPSFHKSVSFGGFGDFGDLFSKFGGHFGGGHGGGHGGHDW